MTPSPTAPRPPIKPLAAAETAVRRLLLMVGFGFMAFVGGSIVAFGLMIRIGPRLDGTNELTLHVLRFLLDGAWVMVALPAIAYFASRFLEMKPLPTGVIGAGTGLMFQLALQYVSSGEEGILGEPTRQVGRLVAVGLGIALTALAVRRGRDAALVAEEKARVEAEKKKTQYDEFVRGAEALANRREQVPIAPPQPVEPAKPPEPVAAAVEPEPAKPPEPKP